MRAAQGGLFDALRKLAVRVIESGKTRLELIANEIEEGKQRALEALLYAQGLVFCAAAAVLFAVCFLTVLFWENRLVVLGAATLAFAALAVFFFGLVRRAARRPEYIFAASIKELQNDLRELKAAAGYEPPAAE
jgi:uncharacterized membrane protein YqjE